MDALGYVQRVEETNKRGNMETYVVNSDLFGSANSMIVTSSIFSEPNTIKIISGKHGSPRQGTPASAGFDLTADLIEPITVEPNQTVPVSTGLMVELPPNVAALVLPRSGLAMKHCITVANSPGLIDPDYRGDIKVLLRNEGNVPYIVRDGDRIAQLLFVSFIVPSFVENTKLENTIRGTGGFGSTGG